MKPAHWIAIILFSMIAIGCEDETLFNGSEQGTNAGSTGDVTGEPVAEPGSTDAEPVLPTDGDKAD